jgi:hypothetical protein
MIYSPAEIQKYLNSLQQESKGLCDELGIPITDNNPLGHNDQRDAFRHAYASAIAAYEHGWELSLLGGYYREITSPNELNELCMDLWNNRVGREIGANATSREEIAQKVWETLQNNQLITGLDDPRISLSGMVLPHMLPTNRMDKTRQFYTDATVTRSPIILDLDGNGIQTLGTDAGIHFDHDGNGFKELSGWVAPGDGVLMLDRDADAVLDNGSELFGNFTPLANGMLAVNGFQALAQFDSNGDGKIDANDPIWSQLKIWQHDPEATDIGDPDSSGIFKTLEYVMTGA